ncbi:MAG: alkane 1-monooxygenase [Chthoniobacterales bacterium]
MIGAPPRPAQPKSSHLHRSRLSALPYAAILLFPLSLMAAVPFGGIALWAPLAIYFLIGPVADHFGGRGNGVDPDAIEHSRLFQVIVATYAVLQIGFLVWAVFAFGSMPRLDQISFTLNFGIAIGGAGICCAHELLHKTSKTERFLGQSLLTLLNYGSFSIDHVFIHHNPRITATKEDPSLSHVGQTAYDFIPRAAIGSAVEAFHLEQRRLKTSGYTLRNRVTRTFTISATIALAILVFFGPATFLFYIFQGLGGVSTLWITGYLQHYGLIRRQGEGTSRYVNLSEANSWDCDYYVSNFLLLNLPRHSHHHKTPTQNYQRQRASARAMRLPHGYPLMTLLALVPPLWFRTMNPLLENRSEFSESEN